ncbi:MAG: hypothetical protein QF704_01970 [Anaerolineales bacterium]|jgi:hypothetical protein|nr:hypothetical protein [Anaerolineales bacterium]|tara:strand:- start:122 stop:520 length:399 start_codon:yes stop_codon:yes gene_type:complete
MTVKHRTPKFGYKKRQTPWTDATMNPCDVQVQLEKYMAMVQEKNEQYYKICGFTHSDPDHISADYGKKYARIVKNDQLSGSRSVHTFVNMLNGDILKAGGWSAPQKNGVRGNIFADDLGADRVNEHGANYLK